MKGGLAKNVAHVLSAGLAFAEEGQRAGEVSADVDARQLIISLLGIHFMPFAVGDVLEGFAGSPNSPAFVRDRKAAVRVQTRDLALRRGKK
jgi:hypothetical protein